MDLQPAAPRSIAAILDAAVHGYRRTFRSWWLPSLARSLAGLAWGAFGVVLYDGIEPTLANVSNGLLPPMMLLGNAAVGLVGAWALAMLYVGIAAEYAGTPLGTRAIAVDGARLTPGVIGSFVLIGLPVGAILLVVVGPLNALVPGFRTGAIALAALPVGYLLARLALTLPALGAERAGALAAIGRSWDLTRGQVGRTFAVSVMPAALVPIALLASVGLGTLLINADDDSTPASAMVWIGLEAAIRLVASAIAPIAGVLLYHDLRLRRDAEDLARRASTLPPG